MENMGYGMWDVGYGLRDANTAVQRTAEAVHLVYLHFYAANSLEMQVRSLHQASTYRESLLDCARDHYRRASVLAEAEGQIAARALYPRSNSVTSTHSSMPSLSSSRSSRASSPALSAADDLDYGRPRQVVKQVRFKMTPEIVQEPLEPFIRPDSPTLGSDDMFGLSSPDEIEADTPLLELFPKAPSQSPEPQFAASAPVVDEVREDIMEATRQRYAACLAALHHQIVTVHLPAIAHESSVGPPPPSNSAMRAMEAQARIQRLKSQGWRRKRFDSAKYESLREAALADLME